MTYSSQQAGPSDTWRLVNTAEEVAELSSYAQNQIYLIHIAGTDCYLPLALSHTDLSSFARLFLCICMSDLRYIRFASHGRNTFPGSSCASLTRVLFRPDAGFKYAPSFTFSDAWSYPPLPSDPSSFAHLVRSDSKSAHHFCRRRVSYRLRPLALANLDNKPSPEVSERVSECVCVCVHVSVSLSACLFSRLCVSVRMSVCHTLSEQLSRLCGQKQAVIAICVDLHLFDLVG
jgi:hypothetical protein